MTISVNLIKKYQNNEKIDIKIIYQDFQFFLWCFKMLSTNYYNQINNLQHKIKIFQNQQFCLYFNSFLYGKNDILLKKSVIKIVHQKLLYFFYKFFISFSFRIFFFLNRIKSFITIIKAYFSQILQTDKRPSISFFGYINNKIIEEIKTMQKKSVPLKMVNGSGSSFIGSKFTNLGIIGSGSYGQVYRVKHKQTEKTYAIKIYKHIFTNRILALRTLREIMILRRINNDRIIKIYDIIPPPNFENFTTIAVVLEYLAYDLKRLCQKSITLKDHHIPKIIYQLLVGLKYLRHVKILHRDLKPENILSDNDFNIKICDFGLARPSVYQPSFTQVTKQVTDTKQEAPTQGPASGAFTPQPKKAIKQMTCHVVSRWYRAPELILMQTKYDSSIQMWSVGCILGQLISDHEKNKKTQILTRKRRPLFQGKACFPLSPPKKDQAGLYKLKNGFPHSQDDQISKILQVIGSPSEQQVSFIEQQLASNYIKSLPKYPKKKATQIFQYCKPQWEDFLNKTLLFDPRKRLTIDEALKHPLFDDIRNQQDYNFSDKENFELFLPSDMPMQEIRQKLIQQIMIYQNGVNMTDDEH